MAAFRRAFHLALLGVSFSTFSAFAADPSPEAIKKLEKELTGAKMTGQFTVKEEYTIESAKKLDEGDLWLIKARIKYGDKDSVFPVPVEIRWAGDTPVITLDKVAIPGLGTFSSRVIIYDGKYAGTWQHDQVGGHLFGTIGK
jgi:hypothetical protein